MGSYSISGLTAYTNYYFRVRGDDGLDYTQYSNVLTGRTLPYEMVLSGNIISSTSVELTWTFGSYDINSITLIEISGVTGFSQIIQTNTGVTTQVVSGLTNFTAYHFRVRSYNGVQYSNYSNVLVLSTFFEGEFALKLEISTSTPNTSITIPHKSGAYTHNYLIDYGDGNDMKLITSYDDTGCTHTYVTPATYIIQLSGICETIYYNNTSTTFGSSLTKVLSWGQVGLKICDFYGCSYLTEIPSDTLSGLTNVTNFTNAFSNTQIYNIPEDLFIHATGVTSFSATFANTPSHNLPVDLFRYNTKVTSFSATFNNNGKFTENIPTDLFKYNTGVTSFESTFRYQSFYTTSAIPTDLFKHNTKVTTFAYTFEYLPFNQSIDYLTSIPIDLFRYNTLATNFTSTFQYRSNLVSLNSTIFTYNIAVNRCFFYSTFQYCDGLTGNAPDIWNGIFENILTDGELCFNGCTGLSNYATIPATWK